ncbi:putative cystatin-9-like protein CST9LP1 isoform X1 [Gorilla gorilla gorilla]|uniref:putative cystatin-9-like protein CST9LP1 isoform X1 n=1 Tax=Gorilla gorilla gorilla TaxID=9595 RepID=UPI00300973F2
MWSLPRSRALSWAPLLLLFSFQFPVTYAWRFQEEEEWNDQKQITVYLPPTLEFAMYTFNKQSKDWYAYKLVRVLDSWKEQGYDKMTFSMNLQLGRTMCGKFEDDIDNCPFQESPELNNVRQDTSFPPGYSCGCRMGCGVDTGAADKET